MRKCLFYFATVVFFFITKNEGEAKIIPYVREKRLIPIKPEERNEGVIKNVKDLINKRTYDSKQRINFLKTFQKGKKHTYKIKRKKMNLYINSLTNAPYEVLSNMRKRKRNYIYRKKCYFPTELQRTWDGCKNKASVFIERMKTKTTNYFKVQKKKIENNNMINFFGVMKNVLCETKILYLTVFVMINSAIISIIIPQSDNLLFSDLSNRKLQNFYSHLFQCVVVRIISMILCGLRNYIFMVTSADCIKIVKGILYEIHINKNYEYYDNVDITSVVNNLTIEPHEFSDIIPYYVNPFIRNLFSIMFNFAYIFYLNKRMATVILSCFLFSSFLSIIYSKLKKKRTKMINQQKAKNTKIALETLNNINLVKLYNTEIHECSKYKTSLNHILNLQKKKETFNLIHMIINKFFISITYILIIINGNLLLKQGKLDRQTFTSFFFYIDNIYSYVNILDYYIDIRDLVDQHQPIIQMIKRHTTEKMEEERSKKSKTLQTKETIQKKMVEKMQIQVGGNEKDVVLSFENVSFNYANNANKPLLKNVNLKIYKNTNNVIIGNSGSGKSTLLKLILNLYKCSKGNIYLYKKKISNYSSQEIFKIIAYVEQNSKLLNMTIRENLLYGVNKDTIYFTAAGNNNNNNKKNYDNNNNNNINGANFDMLDLINVSKCCTCHDFISRLTKRYETVVSSKTQLLTSSQIQKICVARALMPSPKILLLDESTSAIDKDNERKIFRNLKGNSFFKNLTIIRITHKQANLDLCDNIFTLKDGNLIKSS